MDDYYIYTFPFLRTRRVTSNYISSIELYVEIVFFFSFFFRVESGNRLFIGPRAHDCYLSIDDKRNPIREARLTGVEKVGKKIGKLA